MLLVRVSAQRSDKPVECSAEGVFFDAKGDCCEPSNVRKLLIEGLANEEYNLLCAESLTIPGLPEATPEDIDALGKCASFFNFDELSLACTLLNKPATSPFTKQEENFFQSPKGKALLSKGFRKEDVKKLPKDKLGRPNTLDVDFRREFGIDFP